jgi:hypothetical protein
LLGQPLSQTVYSLWEQKFQQCDQPFKSQGLSNIVYGFGLLGQPLSQTVYSLWEQKFQQCDQPFKSQGLANIVYGFALLSVSGETHTLKEKNLISDIAKTWLQISSTELAKKNITSIALIELNQILTAQKYFQFDFYKVSETQEKRLKVRNQNHSSFLEESIWMALSNLQKEMTQIRRIQRRTETCYIQSIHSDVDFRISIEGEKEDRILQVDGPTHFIQNYQTGDWNIQRPQDRLLDVILKSDRLQVHRIPYFEWNQQVDLEQKKQYLLQVLHLSKAPQVTNL